MLQILGVISAVGIVSAFAALQFGVVGPHDLAYLVANLLCAGVLTAIAVVDSQYGFIISNGFWTLVAAVGLARGRQPGRVDDRDGRQVS